MSSPRFLSMYGPLIATSEEKPVGVNQRACWFLTFDTALHVLMTFALAGISAYDSNEKGHVPDMRELARGLLQPIVCASIKAIQLCAVVYFRPYIRPKDNTKAIISSAMELYSIISLGFGAWCMTLPHRRTLSCSCLPANVYPCLSMPLVTPLLILRGCRWSPARLVAASRACCRKSAST